MLLFNESFLLQKEMERNVNLIWQLEVKHINPIL